MNDGDLRAKYLLVKCSSRLMEADRISAVGRQEDVTGRGNSDGLEKSFPMLLAAMVMPSDTAKIAFESGDAVAELAELSESAN